MADRALTLSFGSGVWSQDICLGDAYYLEHNLPNGEVCYGTGGFQTRAGLSWEHALWQPRIQASERTVLIGNYSASGGDYVTPKGKQTDDETKAARQATSGGRLLARVGYDRRLMTETNETQPDGQLRAQVADGDVYVDVLIGGRRAWAVADRLALVPQVAGGGRLASGLLTLQSEGDGIPAIPGRECIEADEDNENGDPACVQRRHFTAGPVGLFDLGFEVSPGTEEYQVVSDDTREALTSAKADYVAAYDAINRVTAGTGGGGINAQKSAADQLLTAAKAFQEIAQGNPYLKEQKEIKELARQVSELNNLVTSIVLPKVEVTPEGKRVTTGEGEISLTEIKAVGAEIQTHLKRVTENSGTTTALMNTPEALVFNRRKLKGHTFSIGPYVQAQYLKPLRSSDARRHTIEYPKPDYDDAIQLNAEFSGWTWDVSAGLMARYFF